MAVQSHLPAAADTAHPSSQAQSSGHSGDQWIIPTGKSLTHIRRVVVLVPGEEIYEEKMLDKILENIPAGAREIVFVGANNNPAVAPAKHRRLGRLASRTRSHIVAYEHLLPGTDWVDIAHKIVRHDDLIVICDETSKGIERKLAVLNLPVLVVTGLRPSFVRRLWLAARRVAFEATPFLIIVGFFWLQVQITGQTQGITTTLLTAMSVLFEIGLILVWSLFMS